MRDVERAVENILAERISVQEQIEWSPLRRLEDFSVNNMYSLAIGAAGAILGLSAMMLLGSPNQKIETADPIIVGSIVSRDHSASRTKWIPVKKPVQIMTLEANQVAGIAATYSARRNEQGEHQDTLRFEARSPKQPELSVTLTRGMSNGIAPTLFIDMARQQSDRGVSITKAGQSGMVPTKFGTLEVADMSFTRSEDDARACLAFRSISTKGYIGVSGWYCAANMTVAERPELSCILDKLILLKSGQDKELRQYFTQAENNRAGCNTTRASSGRKPTWLDADGKVPTFRSDITGSIEKTDVRKR